MKKAVRKLLVKSVAESNYSAQEIFHILMGYPLYHSSRDFVCITVGVNEWVCLRGADEQTRGESILQKYAQRIDTQDGENLRDISLHEIARNFCYRNKKWCKKCIGKEAVLRIFSKICLGTDPSRNECYYQQQETSHVTWTDRKLLKGKDETWE